MLQLSVVKFEYTMGRPSGRGGSREGVIHINCLAWAGLAWPGLTVQMQSKQRLQVPTDDSAGQLETRSDWSRSRWSRTSDFSIKRWWAFLWLFFFLFSVHRHAKGETGNPFWPPRRPAGRQGRRRTHSRTLELATKMLPIRQRHSNELVVIVRDERGGCVRGGSLVYAVALRLLYGSLDCWTDTLPPSLLYILSTSWLVVPIFSGHCQSNHI